MAAKRLVIRMSSLGDVVLATACLDSLFAANPALVTDWVVAKEYAQILQGHPQVRQVFCYDRRAGLAGWWQLCRKLWDENYCEVWDLHQSLRSHLLYLLFRCWNRHKVKQFIWHTLPKERLQRFLVCVLKKACPQAWRPRPWVTRYGTLGGHGARTTVGWPNVRHLLGDLQAPSQKQLQSLLPSSYLCVMPSSKWRGKEWGVASFVAVIRQLPYRCVILGTSQDQASLELVRALEQQGVSHVSGVGVWNLREVAQVLAGSRGLLAVDTGLAHLAEALGQRTWVIFGPTTPELGFAPWRKQESRALGAAGVICRPCSRDGSFCMRVFNPYLCLKSLTPAQVVREIGASCS